MVRRMKSIAEMRRQLRNIKGSGSELVVRAYRDGGDVEGRVRQIGSRTTRATQAANRYANRIMGTNASNAMSYSGYTNRNEGQRFGSNFYMSLSNG